MFRWALSQDVIETDPSAGLASYGSSPRRDRVLSAAEVTTFWNWLDTSGMPEAYIDALKLQLATGARIGEVAGIHSDEIDQVVWTWTLPSERSKNGLKRVTPLVGIARKIVERRLNSLGGPLFTAEGGKTLTTNFVASLLTKRRKQIPIPHFTSHDLRRTVATGLVDLGFPLEIVASVLGHQAGSQEVRTLVRHYVRTDLIDRKREVLEAWDTRLRTLIGKDSAEHGEAKSGHLEANKMKSTQCADPPISCL
jgi:integrase